MIEGFLLVGEYYLRMLNNFCCIEPENLPLSEVTDHDFKLQAFSMVIDKNFSYTLGK